MEKAEDLNEPVVQLQVVGKRRAGLRRAMTAVEVASSAALSGRPEEWRSTLSPLVDDLQAAWGSHVSANEGPGGLWEQIRTDAPRLEGQLRRLRREHRALTTAIEDLRESLSGAGDDESRLAEARKRAAALLTQLVRHRQRGADLIYEAYEHDIGGNG